MSQAQRLSSTQQSLYDTRNDLLKAYSDINSKFHATPPTPRDTYKYSDTPRIFDVEITTTLDKLAPSLVISNRGLTSEQKTGISESRLYKDDRWEQVAYDLSFLIIEMINRIEKMDEQHGSKIVLNPNVDSMNYSPLKDKLLPYIHSSSILRHLYKDVFTSTSRNDYTDIIDIILDRIELIDQIAFFYYQMRSFVEREMNNVCSICRDGILFQHTCSACRVERYCSVRCLRYDACSNNGGTSLSCGHI